MSKNPVLVKKTAMQKPVILRGSIPLKKDWSGQVFFMGGGIIPKFHCHFYSLSRGARHFFFPVVLSYPQRLHE